MHSHILPGIDDGSDGIETSLELIRGLKALGYNKLIATPHIMWDMYRNTPEILNRQLNLVREAVKKARVRFWFSWICRHLVVLRYLKRDMGGFI